MCIQDCITIATYCFLNETRWTSTGDEYYVVFMSDTKNYLDNKVIIMNGFSNEEISTIMRVVKQQFEKPRDLIFAKTTKTNLEMKLGELIEDVSGDHAYLQANPPNIKKQT